MKHFKWTLLILLISSCYGYPTCFSLSESAYSLSFYKAQSLPPCLLSINQEYTITIESPVNSLKFKLEKTQMVITTKNQIQRLEASQDLIFLFEITNKNYKFSFQAKLDPISSGLYNCFTTVSISETQPKSQSLRFLSQCPTGFFLNDGACSKVCPLNNYRDGGYCFKCDGNCTTCLSQNTCNPCLGRQSYFEEENICVDKCPENYFNDYNNALCVKCAEGCTTCSFPNGLCTTNYFKTDMIINLIVSSVLFGLVVLCACFCNQEKEENSTQEQQPNAEGETQTPQKGQDQHIQQIVEGKVGGQYNILPEEFDAQGGNLEDDDDGPLPSRRAKKRLTDFAQNKLLKISMSKPFIIDDGNEEKAISHDSASKLFSKRSFSPLFVSKSDISPTLLKGSKFALESDEGSRPNLQSFQNLEEQNAKKLIFDISDSTPTNKDKVATPDRFPGLFLLATKETSLGRKVHQQEDDIENDISLHLNQENDFAEIIYEESSKEGGYQQDSSMNASKDKDESLDYHACTICGLNKRDCMNKPCGHTVACYACMEQFKEQYGVCPKCQRLLSGLTKMQRGKKL